MSYPARAPVRSNGTDGKANVTCGRHNYHASDFPHFAEATA